MALLAAYSFDEASGDILDSSGNSRTITNLTGLSRSGSGHTNNALTSTTAGAVTTAFSAGSLFGLTNDRTVMCWLKGTGEVWHIRWNVTSIDSGAWGLATLGGALQVRARPDTSSVAAASVAAPGDLATTWHHIAGTYNTAGASLKLYLDGTLVATTAQAGPLLTAVDTIDLAEWGAGTLIDDLRIYDETLDVTAIGSAMSTPVGGGGGAAAIAGRPQMYLPRRRAANY